MWILRLVPGGNHESYGNYLMEGEVVSHAQPVLKAIGAIIHHFEDDEWNAEDISRELNERGFKNEFIATVDVDI